MATGRSEWSEWQRRQREAERRRREAERARLAAERERKRLHAERRSAEVDAKNQQLTRTTDRLGSILRDGLDRSARIDLNADRLAPNIPRLDLGPLATPIAPPTWESVAPEPPGPLSRIVGGRNRYERRLGEARAEYARAVALAEQRERERRDRVAEAERAHAAKVRAAEDKARQHNSAIDRMVNGLVRRDPVDVEAYLGRVLASIPLPEGFPRHAEVTFSPKAEQVIVQFELPPRELVPTVANYRYLSTKDEERSTERKKTEVAALYRDVVAQVALLAVRDLFDSDSTLFSVGFNGHVHAIDRATGVRGYPCLISLTVDRSDFPKDENLRLVTPDACVRNLRALVSSHPYELEGVRPLLDFDLSKYKFVEGLDAVSMLDSRPDLMGFTPDEFEHLVRQVFEAQGAEGWNTTHSNDDGVDAVIVRRVAIMGGLCIVQAKRWSKVIGVNHIRELAGAMEEKKAGWGILVTTSWFTANSQRKAREHGRMELIDGRHLTYLIKEHLGKDVLIGIPNRPERAPGDD